MNLQAPTRKQKSFPFRVCGAEILPENLIKYFRLLFGQITITAGSWKEMYFRKQRKHV